MIRLMVLIASIVFVGCGGFTDKGTANEHDNGVISVCRGGGCVSVSVLVVDGYEYVIALGVGKVAICPSAKTLALVNAPQVKE